MRHASGRRETHRMELTDPTRRVILDATIDRSATHGALTAPPGSGATFTAGCSSAPRSVPRGTVPTPECRETKAGVLLIPRRRAEARVALAAVLGSWLVPVVGTR